MTLTAAENFNMMTALIEYLDCTLITCSWFSNYISVVFNPISSQSLKGASTLTSVHTLNFQLWCSLKVAQQRVQLG